MYGNILPNLLPITDVGFNKNMRCMETRNFVWTEFLYYGFNKNMRCMETREERPGCSRANGFNKNMRCMET